MFDDYLKKRAAELGLGRQDTLGQIQAWLDREYPGKCRALSLNNDVLKITTPESSVASELRLRQVELTSLDGSIARVSIQIRPTET